MSKEETELSKFSVEVIDADNDKVDGKVFAKNEKDALEKFLEDFGHFMSEPIKSSKVKVMQRVPQGTGLPDKWEEIPEGGVKKETTGKTCADETTFSPSPVRTVESEEEKEARALRERAAKLKKFEIVKPVRVEVENHSITQKAFGDWT